MTSTAHLTDERAQLLLERLLPAGEAAAAEAHAAGCPDCRELLAAHRDLAEALSGLDVPELPAALATDFTDRVLARIEQRERLAAWERRLGGAILVAATAAAGAIFASAGSSDWAGVVSDLLRSVGGAATALRIAVEAVTPLTSALRPQILIACAAVGLPMLLILARLTPARDARPS